MIARSDKDSDLAVSAHRQPAVTQPPPMPDLAAALHRSRLSDPGLRADFARQGAFLCLDEFLSPETTSQVAASARSLIHQANRSYLPGHKQGGSVSRYTIERLAPFIAQLYRSQALIGLLEGICGDTLLPCPDDDPHAYALY